MPQAARYNDICTGHGSCSPRPNIEASDDVIINGRGAHRVGDAWSIHCSHSGVLASGSSSVFINGRAAGRVGDPVSCGSAVATGSEDVIIGG